MTLREMLQRGGKVLTQAGIEEAKLNAWYLFSYCFSMGRSEYFLRSEELADEKCMSHYEDILRERSRHVPLEYITNETEFMGLSFYVDERVLVPRQDTECVVEEVLKECRGKDVLDLCTGSGCIGISVAALGNCRSVTLSDVSEDALEVAKENAGRNGVNVEIIRSNLFEKIERTFDLIVSNPPYIQTGELKTLMPEVRDHEPVFALDGGMDGLDFYRDIIPKSLSVLRQRGILIFEIGCGQGREVSELMREEGFEKVRIKKDLAGLDRIVCGQIGGKSV